LSSASSSSPDFSSPAGKARRSEGVFTCRSATRGESASYELCKPRRKGDTLRVGPQPNWSHILSRKLIERLQATLQDRAHRHQHISHEIPPAGDDHRTFDQDVSLVPPERDFSSASFIVLIQGLYFRAFGCSQALLRLLVVLTLICLSRTCIPLQKASQTIREPHGGSFGSRTLGDDVNKRLLSCERCNGRCVRLRALASSAQCRCTVAELVRYRRAPITRDGLMACRRRWITFADTVVLTRARWLIRMR
jgi:hypothetical protein